MTVLAALAAAVLAAAIAYPLGRARPITRTSTTAPDPATDPAPRTCRVSVQVVNDQVWPEVEAVAEISDGHATARATHTVAVPYKTVFDHGQFHRQQGDQAEAAQSAAAGALEHARHLLHGAQAGYTTEATAHATRTAKQASGRAGIEQTTAKAGA